MPIHKDYIKEERERMEFFVYLVFFNTVVFLLFVLIYWMTS